MNAESEQPGNESTPQAASEATSTPRPAAAANGPLNLERIRQMRQSLQNATAPQQKPRPPRGGDRSQRADASQPKPTASQTPSSDRSADPQAPVAAAPAAETPAPDQPGVPQQTQAAAAPAQPTGDGQGREGEPGRDRGNRRGPRDREPQKEDTSHFVAPTVERPSVRRPLSSDQESEFEEALAGANLDALMIGGEDLAVGRGRDVGSRYTGKILKIHNEQVFVSLGGPDEGSIPLLQFNDTPEVGQTLDCLVRGFDHDEGLYELALPGESVNVEDWSDIETGSVVDARIESANTGGLECKVGSIRGFIPMSQISEYRVEDASSYVGQTLPCVITEANERRGNLVLSHRAVLERERQEKRAERLAAIEVGDVVEGTVRKVADFGAFVDLGGLDGLIHVSQLSYDRVKHPSEVIQEGEKVRVRVEKIDRETGKIGLSYRAMQEHPWDTAEARFGVGSVVKGTVTRIAEYGVFVKLAPGVEGLVHISEIAHRRIVSAAAVVEEGQEIDVKVLSVDRDAQRMGLSIKQAQAAPPSEAADSPAEEEAPPRSPAVPKRSGPLKGGIGSGGGGEKFGLKW